MILAGRKTQTRRFGAKRWMLNAIHQAKTTYAEDGIFAKLRIVKEPFQQELGKMTQSDAMCEGGFTIHDKCKTKAIDKIYARMACKKCQHSETCFQLMWVRINGTWRPRDKPWVVEFEKLKDNINNNIRIINTMVV